MASTVYDVMFDALPESPECPEYHQERIHGDRQAIVEAVVMVFHPRFTLVYKGFMPFLQDSRADTRMNECV